MRFEFAPPDAGAEADARARWDAVAKPLGSLGKLEALISRVAGIQGAADVRLAPRAVAVFCGDHGVTAEGVSQSGPDVTARVALALCEGAGNAGLMARQAGAEVYCVDMGMARRVSHPALIDRRVAAGTGNIARGPAMTRAQAERAVQSGAYLVGEWKARGCALLAVGEMGIGNTTSAAALACALLGLAPEEAVGRGAGLSDAGLLRKREAVRRALAVNAALLADPLGALAALGGFELAGMAGAFIGGAVHRVPVIVDGAVSGAAALLAERLCPGARAFMLPSHRGREPICAAILRALALDPPLDADLALGEGTGAALLFPLLDMARAVYAGTHTFERLGMAPYAPQGGEEGACSRS